MTKNTFQPSKSPDVTRTSLGARVMGTVFSFFGKKARAKKQRERLSPEQLSKCSAYAEKWLSIDRSTEPADRVRAEAAIRWMYRRAGLAEPTIIWCESPLSMFRSGEVMDSVGSCVLDDVWNSVFDSVKGSVQERFRGFSWSIERDKYGIGDPDSVGEKVQESVVDSLDASDSDELEALAAWLLVGLKRTEIRGQNEAPSIWIYDFFRHECGLTEETDKLSGATELCKSCGWLLPYENICFASERHHICRVDENGLIHSEDGPAVAYPDGFEIYAWHGVLVPSEWINDTANLKPSDVLSCRNVEQRAAGIAILGMECMLDSLEHRILDSDPDPSHGELIEVRIPDLPKPARYLKAQCPRNGTIFEGVPNNIKTVLAAQAWRVGLPASEFVYPSVRT